MRIYWLEHAMLSEGWAEAVQLTVDPGGVIRAVATGAVRGEGTCIEGPSIPGMPNLHSHAFQGAMAGLSERTANLSDDFWSWRGLMYRLADSLTPEDISAVTAWTYLRMLKGGFTSVSEFHYLHHDRDGRPYGNPAELSLRVVAAAEAVGIDLHLLPVFYAHSNFGGAPAEISQRRFLHDVDGFMDLLVALRKELNNRNSFRLGMAPHSLRAVTMPQLQFSVNAFHRMDPTGRVHIHIAEQTREVLACLNFCGQRPVEWLLSNVAVDARFCLVHATHMEPTELLALSKTEAVVGLCPITESNLGDGMFPSLEWTEARGRLGIGSDSNVLVSAAEELRLAEYAQRLRHQRRNVLGAPGESTGGALYRRCLQGGSQASSDEPFGFSVGAPANWITLDVTSPLMASRRGDHWLDTWIFAADRPVVRDVFVRGRQVVTNGRHANESEIEANALSVLRRIF
jgi:formiminoglutamate deiminase